MTRKHFRWTPPRRLDAAKCVICTWLLLITGTSCDALGPTGHRVVGQIASNHLSPRARQAVQRIMGPETLAQAATWPDDIRSDPKYHHGNWHFVTIEDGKSYDSGNRDPLEENVITAIRFNKGVLEDSAATQEDKVIALRWLVHLVGDVHQPLHVGRGADRGGNSIDVVWFGEQTNLHVVWDEGLIESTKLSFSELARFIDTRSPATIAGWQKSTVLDWVDESVMYRSRVYEVPEPPQKAGDKSGSYKYAYKNVPLINQRMVQAGVRLAGLLNSVFADTPESSHARLAGVVADLPVATTADNLSLASLGGTLWAQSGLENHAISISAYHQAQQMLDRALADTTSTALPEKEPQNPREVAALAALPPAIILDADETVLDNSPYQAWLIKQKSTYSSISWNRWVASARATALPGAVEFIDYARSQGVAVFYVTNRAYRGDLDENGNNVIEPNEKDRLLEPYTIANLRAVGLLPQDGDSDAASLLLKGEKPDWGDDKTTRRRYLAEDYRIILLLGDSIGDFIGYDFGTDFGSYYHLDPMKRVQELRKHKHRWARSWIVLPNAMYGGWLPRDHQERLDALDAWDGKLSRQAVGTER